MISVLLTRAVGLAGGLKYYLPESAVEPAVSRACDLDFLCLLCYDSLGCYRSKEELTDFHAFNVQSYRSFLYLGASST